MKTRREYKYLVPVSSLEYLRNAIAPFVEQDPFMDQGEGNEYTVRSIYYDTQDLEAYREKIDGVPHRKKFRIRGYNNQNGEGIDFLEIKQKDGNYISKNRAPVRHVYTNKLLRNFDGEQFILPLHQYAMEDARRFMAAYMRKGLRPVILIVYDREAFYDRCNDDVRITFDKNIRSRLYPELEELYDENGLLRTLCGHFVLEVKFSTGVPGWLRNTLSTMRLHRQSISKYTICIDTHVQEQLADMHLRRMVESAGMKKGTNMLLAQI